MLADIAKGEEAMAENEQIRAMNKIAAKCFCCGKALSKEEVMMGTVKDTEVPLCLECYHQHRDTSIKKNKA